VGFSNYFAREDVDVAFRVLSQVTLARYFETQVNSELISFESQNKHARDVNLALNHQARSETRSSRILYLSRNPARRPCTELTYVVSLEVVSLRPRSAISRDLPSVSTDRMQYEFVRALRGDDDVRRARGALYRARARLR
jgi:hypothetical protein